MARGSFFRPEGQVGSGLGPVGDEAPQPVAQADAPSLAGAPGLSAGDESPRKRAFLLAYFALRLLGVVARLLGGVGPSTSHPFGHGVDLGTGLCHLGLVRRAVSTPPALVFALSSPP